MSQQQRSARARIHIRTYKDRHAHVQAQARTPEEREIKRGGGLLYRRKFQTGCQVTSEMTQRPAGCRCPVPGCGVCVGGQHTRRKGTAKPGGGGKSRARAPRRAAGVGEQRTPAPRRQGGRAGSYHGRPPACALSERANNGQRWRLLPIGATTTAGSMAHTARYAIGGAGAGRRNNRPWRREAASPRRKAGRSHRDSAAAAAGAMAGVEGAEQTRARPGERERVREREKRELSVRPSVCEHNRIKRSRWAGKQAGRRAGRRAGGRPA